MVIAAPPRPRELRGRRAVWRIAEPLDPAVVQNVPSVSRMVGHLLFQRGIADPQEMATFLSGPPPEHDPRLLPDIEAAAERIRRAAQERERVAIWGDFDCDGLTASAILQEAFRILHIEPVVIIPTRDDGHGPSGDRLRELAAGGVTLLVTADCGIADLAALAAGQDAGLDLIVTDHHQPHADGTLPPGLVVSPTRRDAAYPFQGLSGAGVAYKLAQVLLESPDRYLQLLDLAAFGTIADVVPLQDENRALVMAGLEGLRSTRRCGLRALFSVAGIEPSRIDAGSVGWYLGPRINAANRIADPAIAFELITTLDAVRAQRLAEQLDAHNDLRQTQVAAAVEEAVEIMGAPAEATVDIREGRRPPIACVSGSWGPGISGLVASSLVERYGVPALAASPRKDGRISASGRSIRGVNILEILEAASADRPEAFLGFGGHSMACGFITTRERLPEAFAAVEAVARSRVPVDDLGITMSIDAQVRLHQLDLRAVEQIESLAPYGQAFPEPRFLACGIYLRGRRPFGADGRHLKMTACSGDQRVSAICFSCSRELRDFPEDQPLDLAIALVRDERNGASRPQIRIEDWRPHQED